MRYASSPVIEVIHIQARRQVDIHMSANQADELQWLVENGHRWSIRPAMAHIQHCLRVKQELSENFVRHPPHRYLIRVLIRVKSAWRYPAKPLRRSSTANGHSMSGTIPILLNGLPLRRNPKVHVIPVSVISEYFRYMFNRRAHPPRPPVFSPNNVALQLSCNMAARNSAAE